MSIFKLNVFLDYKPNFDKDPQDIVDNIKKDASKYLKKEELDWIQKAYEYARKAHKWVKRKSWEWYIIHPVLTTQFLMYLKPDLPSIQTSFLHDVVEDCDWYEIEDIEKTFWKEVANLCEGLIKVSKIRYKWENKQIETLKKTFLAMWKDIRVIFIKLADGIINI